MATLTYGSIYFSTATATANVTDTPIKAAGTTTTMLLQGFTHPASNRLTYTQGTTRVFEVSFVGSVTKGGATGTNTLMSLRKNGAVITGGIVGRKIANATDEGAFAVIAHVSLAEDDYVELWCEGDSDDDLTIERGVLAAKVLG